ncbi:LCP family protein [Candidatus Dojkabacteria bacterium]|nr:LCP family protein [Candidatus Dojkabacteria bacterium]
MSRTYSVTISDDRMKRRQKRRRVTRGSEKRGRRKVFFLFLILLAFLCAGGYYIYKLAAECEGEGCNPILGSISATIDPKLKQEDGLTNILIVGIDTREDNPGLMNTDTMIVLSVDYENKTAVMTSIPRDLWVKYKLPNGNSTGSKINSAYATGEWQKKGSGIDTLKGAVEEVTGVKIQYYVKVTLKGFVEIVDTIGGVDIDIPEYYKDAYPYEELPDNLQASCKNYYHDGHYCLFEFKEGVEHMDGQRALIYARCRLLSQKGDFDRAARQQRVINAVKDKILSSETLLDPNKLWDMYNIIKANVESSPFTINDIRAAINLRNEIDIDTIGQVVLDPYLGNEINKYIYRPTDNPSRGYYIIAKDQTYKPIQELLADIRKYPGIYNEAPNISVYNATGVNTLEKDWADMLEHDNPLIKIIHSNKIIKNPDNQYTGLRIYKFTDAEQPYTEEYLKKYFGVEEIITDITDGTKAISGENYVVIIGLNSTGGE